MPNRILITAALALLLGACGDGGGGGETPAQNLSFDMQFPESLTGGEAAASPRLAARVAEFAQRGGGEPCAYVGPDDADDPFRNGYQTTRFLISIMATWTCIADLLIDLSAVTPRDGAIVATDNRLGEPGYDAEEPTHYSVTEESASRVTMRLYFGYPPDAPPTAGEDAQFFIAWNETVDGEIDGRMIVDAAAVDAEDRAIDDPVAMRMDFDFGADRREADMFLRFDDFNPWAEGFRIRVLRDDGAHPLGQVFTAHGLVEMKRQFLPLPGIDEAPQLQLFAVADQLGNGAAIEEVRDFALPLIVNLFRDNHLGDYLFDKRDVYFFEDDRDWEYIDKEVIASAYRGARNTPPSGGSWIPFDPSLDMIIDALQLDSDYFTGSKCAEIDDDCNQLLNAVFVDGFAGQEQNQGSDPGDWRSDALAGAVYLDSVYPNGVNWNGAFAQVYAPVP